MRHDLNQINGGKGKKRSPMIYLILKWIQENAERRVIWPYWVKQFIKNKDIFGAIHCSFCSWKGSKIKYWNSWFWIMGAINFYRWSTRHKEAFLATELWEWEWELREPVREHRYYSPSEEEELIDTNKSPTFQTAQSTFKHALSSCIIIFLW